MGDTSESSEITSGNQREAMEHLAHSKVRRRLVFDDPVPDKKLIAPDEEGLLPSLEDAKNQMIKEQAKMSAKWNFDFAKEEPLPGSVEWFQSNESEWVGVRPSELYMRSGPLLFNLQASMISRKSRIKRQLFPKDLKYETGKTLADLQNSRNQIMEVCIKECQDKWNFDFDKEKPLDGPVSWRWDEFRSLWIGLMSGPSEHECTHQLLRDEPRKEENTNTDPREVNENDLVVKEKEQTEKQTGGVENDEENKVELEEEAAIKEFHGQKLGDIVMENKDDIQISNEINVEVEKKLMPIEMQNQITPRNEINDIVPIVRKRKRDTEHLNETGAKRRISFE